MYLERKECPKGCVKLETRFTRRRNAFHGTAVDTQSSALTSALKMQLQQSDVTCALKLEIGVTRAPVILLRAIDEV
jgi:hypothetical protein